MRNGIIPVNKHGNVEVWDYNEALVPGGARYCGVALYTCIQWFESSTCLKC